VLALRAASVVALRLTSLRGASVTLTSGLALAAFSALLTNIGFLLRHRGAVAAPDVSVRRPLKSAVGLFRQKWWTIGYLIAALAYVLHVGALSLAALSLVQAVLAGGLVILGVLGERFFGFKLGRRQWIGITLTATGLAFLALSGEAKSGQESAEFSAPAMIAFQASLVGVGTALLVSCCSERAREQLGVLLGVVAGLLFTMTHVAVKALTGTIDRGAADLLFSPYLLIALVGGVVAFFASARSLQIGPAVPVIALTSIASNASAIPAGVIVFGDPLGTDAPTVALRSLAFVLVVAAAALIPAPTRAAKVDSHSPKRDAATAAA
jgi:drug/metabolite transporter (DMT)-like permease